MSSSEKQKIIFVVN